MKKLLVVLLALTFVVLMATVTFAVATTSVDGKVEWTFKNSDQFGGSDDGKIVLDLGKDFGEGYSAGLKIKLQPNENDDVLGADKKDSVKFDGAGWIKMQKDYGAFTFNTGDLGGNAANELGTGYDMDGKAGVKFESTTLVDGLSLTVVLNDEPYNATTTDTLVPSNPEQDGNYFNYLLKAVYTGEALTLGAGIQTHTLPADDAADTTKNDAMAVWAGYKVSDALSLGLEYGSRPNMDGVDVDGNAVTGSTAILLKADYTADPLTINGKVLMTTGTYWLMDPDDVGSISAFNYFKFGKKVGAGADPKDGSGVQGTAVKVDVTYKLTDALSLNASVEDIMAEACYGTDGVKLTDDQLMSYKLGVSDVVSDKLTVSGYYAGYGKLSEIEAKAEYTFVAGLVGSLELKSDTTEGADAVNSYTATLKATL